MEFWSKSSNRGDYINHCAVSYILAGSDGNPSGKQEHGGDLPDSQRYYI